MTRLLLAILGLGFALALSSSWGSREAEEVHTYAVIAKVEKPQRPYSRKW